MSATTLTMNPASIHRKPVQRGPAQPAPVTAYNPSPPPPPRQHSLPQQHQRSPQPYQPLPHRPRPDAPIPTSTPSNGSPSAFDHRASSIYSVAPSTAYPTTSTRRTLSNATSSTSSTSTNAAVPRNPTAANLPRRTGSSRSAASTASPTSYVALMRKQKATVWCDRAQREDPRILAAQRAAKMRAAMEVAGASHNRVSTSSANASAPSVGIRSKIRHHGAPKASTYAGGVVGGAGGVPMRLSASEVDEDGSDEETGGADSKYMGYYARAGGGATGQRNGSRGSSLRSGHRGQLVGGVGAGAGAGGGQYLVSNSSSAAQSPVGSMGSLAEEATPMPRDGSGSMGSGGDYFSSSGGQGGSGGSVQAERNFGALSRLPQRDLQSEEEQRKISEDLRRRGSVDDRTMTLSAGRLFVANPDLSD